MKIEEIEEMISMVGWFHFGEKEFECPGLSKENIEYYKRNKKLPPICDTCYKALIFWKGAFSKENIINLLNMLNSIELKVRGKFNRDVVVFYFNDKSEMLNFLGVLEQKSKEFNVKGKVQWRRACREYQEILPQLWKSAKEFIPDKQEG